MDDYGWNSQQAAEAIGALERQIDEALDSCEDPGQSVWALAAIAGDLCIGIGHFVGLHPQQAWQRFAETEYQLEEQCDREKNDE